MTQTLATDMHFLFDVHLRYQESMVAMARPEDAGDLVASGTGHMHAPLRVAAPLDACRIYRRADGLEGAPVLGELRSAPRIALHNANQ